jgi:tRNA threonylcarbamoyl adenosine modification protein YjeE
MAEPTRAQRAPSQSSPLIAVALPDEASTVELGGRIAVELEPGDVVTLSGEIGAGKTTLARAILTSHLGDPDLEVPSPTFTLMQSYEGRGGPVIHADLYRIGGETELVELGFADLAEEAIVLVEWPDRALRLLKPARLEVVLELDTATGARRALLSGRGRLLDRMARADALRRLLERAGWAEAERHLLQGDASTRAYERLVKPTGERAILMIAPPRPTVRRSAAGVPTARSPSWPRASTPSRP